MVGHNQEKLWREMASNLKYRSVGMLAGIIARGTTEMKGWLLFAVQERFGWIIQLQVEDGAGK